METNFKLEDFKVNDIIKASYGDIYLICVIRSVDKFVEKIYSDILYNSGGSFSKKCSFGLINDHYEIVQNYGNMSFEEFKEQYPEEFI